MRNNNHTTAAPLLSESNHKLCGATTDTGSCGCGNYNNIQTHKRYLLVATLTLHSATARMTHKPITKRRIESEQPVQTTIAQTAASSYCCELVENRIFAV